jgi:pyruvate/2-oxoglutarate dehydrogenase complex dihydrolipoamide acyltransferase (E2) component
VSSAAGDEQEAGEASSPGRSGGRGETNSVELSRARAAYARRVAESKATIPHLYVSRRVSVGDGDLLVPLLAAAAAALRAHPRLNSSYRDGRIEEHSRVNVGFLVETGDAPVVPTLADADTASVEDLSEWTTSLAASARDGSITAPDLAAATFTVTRLEFGADRYAPTIVPGQAGILAAGAPGGGEAELTLACDARIVLAPEGADFLATVAAGLDAGETG